MKKLQILKSDLLFQWDNIKMIITHPTWFIPHWFKSSYQVEFTLSLFDSQFGCWYVGDDGRGNWPWIEFHVQLYVISFYLTLRRQLKV